MRLILIPVLLCLAACSEPAHYQASINDAAIKDAMLPPAPDIPTPPMEFELPDLFATFSSAEAPQYASPRQVRIDASSPEAFLASLQSAEASLHPEVASDLKDALFVLTTRAQSRFVQYAATNKQPIPKEQLFQVAYADLHGATVEDVVLQGARYARDTLNASQSK